MSSGEVPDDGPRSIFEPAVRSTTIGLLILITLIAFEAMAVSAALPTAAREVHGLGGYGWAFTGFLVANVIGMVASGQLSDARGARAPLVAGLVAFLGGLVLAGTASTMAQLVAGRCVQGLGGGLMITAIYVVMGEAYSDRVRPALFAAISSAWVVPSLVGPLVSGLLTQHASWRWVFLGLVPFVLVGGALMGPALRSLRAPGAVEASDGKNRLGQAVAVAAGIAVLEQAGQQPSALVLIGAVVGLVAIVWGLRRLLPPGTATVRPGVAAPIALRGLLAGAFFGIECMVPLALTVQHGFSATEAGLPLTVSGVSWAAGSWWQGRDIGHDGARRRIGLIRAGFAFITLAGVGMALTALPSTPGWVGYPSWLVAGLGAGLGMSSVGVLVLRYTTEATRGRDSAALQLSDATTSAATTGVAGILVAAAARGAIGYTAAFVTLDLLMCGVALVGVATAGRARPAADTASVEPAGAASAVG